jgi:hypothetical protein
VWVQNRDVHRVGRLCDAVTALGLAEYLPFAVARLGRTLEGR